MPLTLIETEDGSFSSFDVETGELYHNRAGAYTEALKTYLEPSDALAQLRQTGSLKIMDVCFGLGYNSWVLLNELLKDPPPEFTVSILAIERDPEILALIPSVLNNPMFCALKFYTGLFEHNIYYQTLESPLRFTIPVTDKGQIEMEVRVGDVRREIPALREDGSYDLVFHDPFSARKVPELWSVELFQEYQRLLAKPTGRVLTYSVASGVRGGLKEAGFELWNTQAVGRKSGGTLASFPGSQIACDYTRALNHAEREKLTKAAGLPYRDPGFACSREQVLQARAIACAQF